MSGSMYGRACMNCFKSKCKCVIRPGSDRCERCHRLNKQCIPAESVRKRNTQNHVLTKTAQLEEKLDGIVSLLQSVTRSPATGTAIGDALGDATAKISTTEDRSHQLYSENSASIPAAPRTDEQVSIGHVWESAPRLFGVASIAQYDLPVHSAPTVDTSASEDEKCLNTFRSEMVINFPFVHLPSTLTAQQLRQDRPLLLQSIMAVSSTSSNRKLELGKELISTIIQKVFISNQGNIDCLLGLLTFIAWNDDHALNKNHFMQLAISLVFELRLNKPIIDEGQKFVALVSYGSPRPPSGTHTLEQRRAVLGCYILSSTVSSFLGKIDPMQWTPQIEEHLCVIGSNKGCPTDEYFALQVRLQLLLQRATQIRDQEVEYGNSSIVPPALYLKAFKTQLQDIKGLLTPALEQKEILMANFHYVELTLHERAYPPKSSLTSNTTSSQHLQCLCTCLMAIKSWLDIFSSLPPSSYVSWPFHLKVHGLRSLVALYKLSTYEDPAWDQEAVRNTVDLLLAMDQMVDKLERVNDGSDPDKDMLAPICRMLRGFRAFFAARMEPAKEPLHSHEAMTENDLPPQFIDFSDESWLHDMLGWSSY